ncbi:helix-turn-helix domain-containing protein [Micromonospora sp. NBC_01813]|uniref:helix-turn-helix domain-containing protein n=1 Tax=Micromonospora sp. NBC_01813 TaxID=2975988 RepID=UPI002DDA142E|nr:helix-turn-helix domain-containing protein [Micromonospora sp. NBC_01813]WSA09727.1 helix-turn-helix domain-containing protein [Micromonospora sp. NBC_01813]
MPSPNRELLLLLAVVNSRLSGDVSLPVLAAWAHRSRFDLHRRFRRLVGETPKAYTVRVRLARAAAELVSTDRRVSAVALDHGFASPEVFTRTFTRHLGQSPRAYRARGLHVAGRRAAATHASTTAAVAPCISLYHISTTERKAAVPLDISVRDLPTFHALVMRRRVTRDEIATALAECLPTVFGYAQRHGLAIAGPPFARYPEVGMGSLVIEAGVSIAAPPSTAPDDGIEALTITAGRAVVAVHRGPYDNLPATYQQIEKWIREQGLSPAGPPWETYLTDPGERPDPATWETEIVQPLESAPIRRPVAAPTDPGHP